MNYEYCDGITHTIKQGETLYSLSRYYKVPLAILLRANPYIDVYNLKVGNTICVPVKNGRNNRMENAMPANASMDMENAMPANAGMNMENAMPANTGMNMENAMPANAGMNMENAMPTNTGMNMDTFADMQRDKDEENGMQRNMASGINVDMEESMSTDTCMNNKDFRHKNDDKEKCWIKYVAQAGDTLQDIFDRSDCSKEMFWDKNNPDRMYMLPGVAYFILEND